mmetsp:Transcript_1250/g.2936  ORF Transcript_1250/g.2936 Transcript_1250/m.2936 type:complete len:425 (-) Transcript_1250:438-1712(-)
MRRSASSVILATGKGARMAARTASARSWRSSRAAERKRCTSSAPCRDTSAAVLAASCSSLRRRMSTRGATALAAPVDASRTSRDRTPLASTSKDAVMRGSPAARNGMPDSSNIISKPLSLVLASCPSQTSTSTHGWRLKCVEKSTFCRIGMVAPRGTMVLMSPSVADRPRPAEVMSKSISAAGVVSVQPTSEAASVAAPCAPASSRFESRHSSCPSSSNAFSIVCSLGVRQQPPLSSSRGGRPEAASAVLAFARAHTPSSRPTQRPSRSSTSVSTLPRVTVAKKSTPACSASSSIVVSSASVSVCRACLAATSRRRTADLLPVRSSPYLVWKSAASCSNMRLSRSRPPSWMPSLATTSTIMPVMLTAAASQNPAPMLNTTTVSASPVAMENWSAAYCTATAVGFGMSCSSSRPAMSAASLVACR